MDFTLLQYGICGDDICVIGFEQLFCSVKLLQDGWIISQRSAAKIFWKKKSENLLVKYGFLNYSYTLPLAKNLLSSQLCTLRDGRTSRHWPWGGSDPDVYCWSSGSFLSASEVWRLNESLSSALALVRELRRSNLCLVRAQLWRRGIGFCWVSAEKRQCSTSFSL